MSFLKKINVFVVMSTTFLYFSLYPLVLVISESTSLGFSFFAKNKKSEQAYPTWLLLRNNDVTQRHVTSSLYFAELKENIFGRTIQPLSFIVMKALLFLKLRRQGGWGKVD